MPTGRCRYPDHHAVSAGPPLGFIGAVIIGALLIHFWHVVVVTVAVVVVLALLAIGVLMLFHAHHSVPYDHGWAEPEPQAAVSTALAVSSAVVSREPALQARVAELEAQLAARQIEQHLHIHLGDGASAEELARVLQIGRQS